eukprot:TRINITY_DN6687_c0_g1_i1.p1 TRINITY_DN6687_c0_g1~~TRINITY_DN6687_c0_g1_i1.p1  ORF type:complete len:648 (+),score=165.50 TRINITY_DN6687_c0_g1_i1:83-2026(+)
MVLMRCCRAVVQRSLREEDTAEERRRKELWVPICTFCATICLVYQAVYFGENFTEPTQVGVLGKHVLTLGATAGVAVPLVTRRLSVGFAVAVTMVLGVGTILLDWAFAAARATFRPWAFVVLNMDVHLALNFPHRYQHMVLHTTALWVMLTYANEAFALGLHSYDGFSNRTDVVIDYFCTCADPPCGASASSMLVFLLPCLVLYSDFYATRGFAEGLRREQSTVLASVVTAERVAEGLAAFDLDAAGAALAEAAGEALPPRLSASFRRLLTNLARYRPYLPQSCFEEGDAEEDATEASGASIRSPQVAFESPPEHFLRVRPSGSPEMHRLSYSTESRPGSVVSARSRRSPRSLHSSFADSAALSAPPVRHAQLLRRVTLLQRNSCSFLAAARGHSEAVQQWLTEEVQRFTDTVSQQGGVSDLLSGDHFSASFGAIKVQGSQCTSATRAAVKLAEPRSASGGSERLGPLQSTAAVCCGKALCGSYGTATAQRFMILGGVSSFAVAAERAAAAWGIAALISTVVHFDAEQLWSCRLRYCAIFPKLDSKPVMLWEVMEARMEQGANDEWMYELEAAQDNAWESYNVAVAKWCTTSSAAEALACVAQGNDKEPKEAVGAALAALREALQRDAAPPVGELARPAPPAPLGAL